jgi:hypothetical protein
LIVRLPAGPSRAIDQLVDVVRIGSPIGSSTMHDSARIAPVAIK